MDVELPDAELDELDVVDVVAVGVGPGVNDGEGGIVTTVIVCTMLPVSTCEPMGTPYPLKYCTCAPAAFCPTKLPPGQGYRFQKISRDRL